MAPQHRTGLIATGVAAITLIGTAAYAWPCPRLDPPTGPYALGTTTRHWVDHSRPDITIPDAGVPREVVAQVWYPAKAGASGRRARYVEDRAFLDASADLARVPRWLLAGIGAAEVTAIVDAPPAAGRFPVLVYATGLLGSRSVSTFQVQELASHGYVVVALDQPGASGAVTLADGRVVPGIGAKPVFDPLLYQGIEPRDPAPTLHGRPLPDGIAAQLAQDVSFALDQLAAWATAPDGLGPHLDLDRTGAFGVSLGGTVVAEAAARDERIKATLVLESPLTRAATERGLPHPVMVVTRNPEAMRRERARTGGWTDHEIDVHQRTMRSVVDQAAAGQGWFVRIDGLSHLDFTDVPAWTPLERLLGWSGPLDGRRGHTLINALSLSFFDHVLRDGPAPESRADEWPEVIVEL